jgi:hypothetical protein
MSARRRSSALLALLALAACLGPPVAPAGATGLSDDGGAEWRVEQPLPPAPPTGVAGSSTPIGLGKIGDIEFEAPNRGVLITAGSGSTIPPGVWLYDGERWRELATVCGGSDGRIAWAGPNEFWTVSDGRTGQASEAHGQRPPLEDNTLCHFAPGPSGGLEVLASYGEPAFQSNSYQAMHAAACIEPSDCWFAGDPLPAPQIGAFQLHWNGHTVTAEPYLPEGHAVRDMRPFEGRLYESVQLLTSDRVIKHLMPPPALRTINPEGASPVFEAVEEPEEEELLYGRKEFPSALEFLHLGAGENALWAAAGPALNPPPESAAAGVTVLRYSKIQYSQESREYVEEGSPRWTQVLGPNTVPSGLERFFTIEENAEGELEPVGDVVNAIAAEPGTNSAWIALGAYGASGETGPAHVARIAADGAISDELQLPEDGETSGYGPKGAAEKIVCPAVHDCWMATSQGWLMHLATAGERTLPTDSDSVFASAEPIANRPPDESVPQVAPDTVPIEDSGLEEAKPPQESLGTAAAVNPFATVTLPLLSHIRSRLVHRTTLELSFHLAVEARVRLVAKHRAKVIASTPTQTLKAGNRRLLLRLNAKLWPTKLDLQTHALAPLPTASTREAGSNTNTVTTSLAFPNALGPFPALLPFPELGQLL